MAVEMVNHGANVVINGRWEQELAEAAKEIDPSGKQVRFVAVSLPLQHFITKRIIA
jgi:NADP-dependent 3-hydroxy acid dehydrogenase YdfG